MPAPTIPTSFVPHQQFVPATPRPKSSGYNLFLIGAIVVFVLTIAAAAGTFGYQKYLESVRDSKEATVAQEQQGIDSGTVEGFVALSNRLAAANTILNSHITSSTFFDLLEGITLQDVSITSLTIDVADDRSATLSLAGTAKTFNALAAESAAFAQQPLIKHAIFSGLNASKDGTVDFTVTADLDPKLIMQGAAAVAPTGAAPAPASASASSTPSAPVAAPQVSLPQAPATTTTPAAPIVPAVPSAPKASTTTP